MKVEQPNKKKEIKHKVWKLWVSYYKQIKANFLVCVLSFSGKEKVISLKENIYI